MNRSSQNASETHEKFIDYRFLNELEGVASRNSSLPYLLQDGRRTDENLKIPNELKTVFVRIGQKLKEHNPNEICFGCLVNNLTSVWFNLKNCTKILQLIQNLKK